MSLKKTIGKLHLWLGLASGLIVFIVSITGCLYAFKEELEDLTKPYRFVAKVEKPVLLPSQLKQVAEAEIDSAVVRRISYGAEGRAAEADMTCPGGGYYRITLNPYTGKVLHVQNYRTDFFTVVLYLHMYLLLPRPIGSVIVSSATIVFIIMMISGIVLWWPKNRSAAKQRFSIKWNAKWKRVNYDIHNVLGFYMSWIVIFIALTGLVWGFEWFSKSVYWASSGGKKMPEYVMPRSDTSAHMPFRSDAADFIFNKVRTEHPDSYGYSINFPSTPDAPVAAYTNFGEGTYYKVDFRYFDQYTLKELPVDHYRGRYKEADTAAMVMRLNYDIHVGAVFGLTGKVIAFLASLLAASLPVTGLLLWLGRKKKKRAEKKIYA